MINPLLNCNRVFRQQVEECLSFTFHSRIMETIKYCLRKNNTCVMALIFMNDNNGVKPKKMYKVLTCVLYSLMENYVCFDYLSCQAKP